MQNGKVGRGPHHRGAPRLTTCGVPHHAPTCWRRLKGARLGAEHDCPTGVAHAHSKCPVRARATSETQPPSPRVHCPSGGDSGTGRGMPKRGGGGCKPRAFVPANFRLTLLRWGSRTGSDLEGGSSTFCYLVTRRKPCCSPTGSHGCHIGHPLQPSRIPTRPASCSTPQEHPPIPMVR